MTKPPPGVGRRAGARFYSDNDTASPLRYTLPRRSSNGSRLVEPLRQLHWLRQALDLWNEAEGNRPMPQPEDYGIRLPRLRPSEVHWRRRA